MLSGISGRLKDVAEADLEIYRMEDTGVIQVKITDTSRKSLIYAVIEVNSSVITWIIDNTWNIIDYYKLRHKANAIMVKKENTALILKLTPLYQVFEIRTCSSKISF